MLQDLHRRSLDSSTGVRRPVSAIRSVRTPSAVRKLHADSLWPRAFVTPPPLDLQLCHNPRDLVLRGITAAAAQAYDSLVRLGWSVDDKPEWMDMEPPVTNLVSKRREQATEIVVRVAPL